MSGQRKRLHEEGADLQSHTRDERFVNARLARNLQTVRSRARRDSGVRRARGHTRGRGFAHHRDRIREGRDTAHMVPVGVRGEHSGDAKTELIHPLGYPGYLFD